MVMTPPKCTQRPEPIDLPTPEIKTMQYIATIALDRIRHFRQVEPVHASLRMLPLAGSWVSLGQVFREGRQSSQGWQLLCKLPTVGLCTKPNTNTIQYCMVDIV
jgi:hypothetical protein